MISPSSSNPLLTEAGPCQCFARHPPRRCSRYRGRQLPGRSLARQKGRDSSRQQDLGRGLAEETKKQFNRRGLTEIFHAYVPGGNDYAAEMAKLEAAGIAVLYIGGYHTEIALMLRLARDRGYLVQLVTGATLASEEFGLIAGPAAEGALFLDVADPLHVPRLHRLSSGSERRVSNRRATRSTQHDWRRTAGAGRGPADPGPEFFPARADRSGHAGVSVT